MFRSFVLSVVETEGATSCGADVRSEGVKKGTNNHRKLEHSPSEGWSYGTVGESIGRFNALVWAIVMEVPGKVNLFPQTTSLSDFLTVSAVLCPILERKRKLMFSNWYVGRTRIGYAARQKRLIHDLDKRTRDQR